MVLVERDPIMGVGRALPHNGLSALQAWNTSKASTSKLRRRTKKLTRFIRDRTMR